MLTYVRHLIAWCYWKHIKTLQPTCEFPLRSVIKTMSEWIRELMSVWTDEHLSGALTLNETSSSVSTSSVTFISTKLWCIWEARQAIIPRLVQTFSIRNLTSRFSCATWTRNPNSSPWNVSLSLCFTSLQVHQSRLVKEKCCANSKSEHKVKRKSRIPLWIARHGLASRLNGF